MDDWRINSLSSEQFIKQICSLLQLSVPKYELYVDAVKTEALKTLASVIFLEKPRKMQLIVNSLDLSSYHGFTPSLVRKCVEKLKTGSLDHTSEYSVGFVTALFSLIYHIAGLDYGNF